MDTGTADTLGRVGGGPGEYQQPDAVFPLPGDSTLLVDIGRTYLTVIGPDGTFHDGQVHGSPTEEGMPTIILPDALDRSRPNLLPGHGGDERGASGLGWCVPV